MSFRSAPMTRTDRAFGEAASAPTAKAPTRSASAVAVASNSRSTAAAYVTSFSDGTRYWANRWFGALKTPPADRVKQSLRDRETGRTTLPRTDWPASEPDRADLDESTGAMHRRRGNGRHSTSLCTTTAAGHWGTGRFAVPHEAPYPSQCAHRSIFQRSDPMALERSMTLAFHSMNPESGKPKIPNYLQVPARYRLLRCIGARNLLTRTMTSGECGRGARGRGLPPARPGHPREGELAAEPAQINRLAGALARRRSWLTLGLQGRSGTGTLWRRCAAVKRATVCKKRIDY